ncbi:hypothetical protein COB28_04420 [Candidatus Dependentiae bacterium]|nr:MAG: hypothetical protein COB28_04420 [Candidatus Dependentiae bacterium]
MLKFFRVLIFYSFLIPVNIFPKEESSQLSTQKDSVISEIVIRIKGMTCPFCSYSLERALENFSYVKKVKNIDLSKGTATFTIKEDSNVTLDTLKIELKKVIEQAAFNFDGIVKVIRK